jgi:hypothetical protein
MQSEKNTEKEDERVKGTNHAKIKKQWKCDRQIENNRNYEQFSRKYIRNEIETNGEIASTKQRPTTHIACGILVGAGIDQQPRTVRATMPSGTHQRRISTLRVRFAAAHSAAAIAIGHTRREKY